MSLQRFIHSCFLILLWVWLCCAMNTSSVNFYLDEVRSLSELPLEKLIKIKSSFAKRNIEEDYDFEPESRASSAMSIPIAMPLKRMSMARPTRRYEEWEDTKGKDTKISKIFQLTVTALSFLAFGGYLLTLIITAIRRGQNIANPGNVIVLSNLQSLQKVKRPKRGLFVLDPAENEYDVDHLYRGMIMLSSEFSNQYH